MAYQSPDHLASTVQAALADRRIRSLGQEDVASLLHIMFAASLHTEEGRAINAQLVVVDPRDPDPDPPERIVANRWHVTPLAAPLALEVPALVKLASATDPRTSWLAVYASADGLNVWGLVDQANEYFDFLNFDSDEGPAPPGDFHIRIEGPGHLTVWASYHKIGELRVNKLVDPPLDALGDGPILDALLPGISDYIEDVRSDIPDDMYQERGHWDGSLTAAWLGTLSRLLLRARNFRHGGAFLLTPDDHCAGLDIKYGISYPRLRSALVAQGKSRIAGTAAADAIAELLDADGHVVPVDLHLDEVVERDSQRDISSEIDSAVWFVALLSRVDGLVLMDMDLVVSGFGVVITIDDTPDVVLRARDPLAENLQPADYSHYGTRHRSMMRYCASRPGSVGFVISQDGDVRVMTTVNGRLVMWDNIRLELHDFAPWEADHPSDRDADD